MNQKEFNTLLDIHQDRLYKLIRSRVSNDQDAEDILQEVLLKIYKNHATFKGNAQLNTWFYTICRHAIADYYRTPWWKFSWKSKTLKQRGNSCEEPEQKLLATEQNNEILTMLKNLPNQEQEVFKLRFLDHFSLQEIAICRDISLSTVKTHLYRAVKKMRTSLQKEEGTP